MCLLQLNYWGNLCLLSFKNLDSSHLRLSQQVFLLSLLLNQVIVLHIEGIFDHWNDFRYCVGSGCPGSILASENAIAVFCRWVRLFDVFYAVDALPKAGCIILFLVLYAEHRHTAAARELRLPRNIQVWLVDVLEADLPVFGCLSERSGPFSGHSVQII